MPPTHRLRRQVPRTRFGHPVHFIQRPAACHSLLEAHEPPPRDPTLDWLALTRIEGLGPVRLARLLARFGSPSRIFSASPSDLEPLVLGEAVLKAILGPPDFSWALQQVRRTEDLGGAIVCLDDPLYPESLRQIPAPPPLLFVLGSVPLSHPQAAAVVGTRSPSGMGSESCGHLVREWARQGVRIVSGLARGIDEIAHQSTLECEGETVAVLGCGLDHLVRSSRISLARAIAAKGAIVTEFPFEECITKGNFPRRNRIISGLSQAVVVAEAGEKSGALITARYALEQGRDVLACPGPVGWDTFAGCHRLLREGAALCARAQDLHDQMGWASTIPKRRPDTFLDLLSGPGATPEEIAVKMNQNVHDIQLRLVLGEIAGDVVRSDGGRWRAHG